MTSTPEWPNAGGFPSQQSPFTNPAAQPMQPTGQPAGAQPWGPPQVGVGIGVGPGGPTGFSGPSGYIGPVSLGTSYGGQPARRLQPGMSFAAGSTTSKLVGLIFALVGIGVAALGIVEMHSAKIPKSLSASASGTIVALNTSWTRNSNAGPSQTCDPVASFQVGTQQLTAKTPGNVRSSCNWYRGETVAVRYDPNQPGHADITTGIGSRSTGGMVVIAFGIVFAAAGLLSTFGSRFGFVRVGTRTRPY